eukprot:gnl/TRDRNA2_/TRDRNA2_30349_c0_seq1.p1 gnl/TRDRNA2_/TRDRNA2_30349_c0~~gnl/TRDRNA2_/TRDRNA2_30349_c0_seq1.p1  ORF type:complete len:303 (+),score=41.88 gnl/TRDRNA2_/TRDRNA2_30349_c0_seq1:92-1000(+)
MAHGQISTSQVELRGLEDTALGPQVLGAPDTDRNDAGVRRRSRGSAPEVMSDEDLPRQEALADHERPWSLAVTAVSGFDLLASGTIMTISFKFAYLDNGVSLYCLGLQALSHLISSLLLMVRFMGDLLPRRDSAREPGAVSEECLLVHRRRRDLIREQALSVFMGLVILISSAALLFKAARKAKFWDVWYKDHTTMDREIREVTEHLAWWGFVIYVLQAAVRFVGAWHIRRSIVCNGGVTSVVSLLFMLVLGLAASYEKEWSWKAEPIAAAVLAMVMLCEGIRIVYLHLDDMDTRMRYEPRA